MSLLVVGSVAFDTLETPFGVAERIVGGSGAYISLTASQFVKPIHLVSVVGRDFPQSFLDELKGRGVGLDGLEIRKDEDSFFWHGRYHKDLNTRDTLETRLNVLATFNPVVPEVAKTADYLILGNLTPDVQRGVIEQLTRKPKLIVLDTMNFWMDVALESLHRTLRMVDVLTINDEEARQLSGEYSLRKAARKILQMGPTYLIIKKGEHGALLFYKEEVFFAPALPLEEVFDPTGAGDTFAGGLIGYIAKTGDTSFENLKRAIIYGSAMASFCVERFGTERLLNLTERDIQLRLDEFQALTRLDMVRI
jgi:sugar/nucleoside kinase (ribokinase family)